MYPRSKGNYSAILIEVIVDTHTAERARARNADWSVQLISRRTKIVEHRFGLRRPFLGQRELKAAPERPTNGGVISSEGSGRRN